MSHPVRRPFACTPLLGPTDLGGHLRSFYLMFNFQLLMTRIASGYCSALAYSSFTGHEFKDSLWCWECKFIYQSNSMKCLVWVYKFTTDRDILVHTHYLHACVTVQPRNNSNNIITREFMAICGRKFPKGYCTCENNCLNDNKWLKWCVWVRGVDLNNWTSWQNCNGDLHKRTIFIHTTQPGPPPRDPKLGFVIIE